MDPDPDADPDPLSFVIDLHEANKKRIKKKKFFCLLLLEGALISFFKGKKSKRSNKTVRNQGFSYCFCLMIEGSRSGAGARSGSMPLTNGSVSRRPKNIGSDGFGSAIMLGTVLA
jgi:hypothetical protein